MEPRPIHIATDAAEIHALTHATRTAILEALSAPASAAEVARSIGQPRQLVNHHLKVLAGAGLVELVEERRKGNFVELLYRAIARGFLVAPEATWGPERLAAARQHHALGTLVDLGGRLQRDAMALLDRAPREEVPSATVSVELRFTDERDREAFIQGYVSAIEDLVDRYASHEGDAYRVVMVAYPDASEGEQ